MVCSTIQSLVSLVAAGKPRENVDKIILEAHFGLGANVKMPAMATAIVNAANTLFPSDPLTPIPSKRSSKRKIFWLR